jgi:hypothetical protein
MAGNNFATLQGISEVPYGAKLQKAQQDNPHCAYGARAEICVNGQRLVLTLHGSDGDLDGFLGLHGQSLVPVSGSARPAHKSETYGQAMRI